MRFIYQDKIDKKLRNEYLNKLAIIEIRTNKFKILPRRKINFKK